MPIYYINSDLNCECEDDIPVGVEHNPACVWVDQPALVRRPAKLAGHSLHLNTNYEITKHKLVTACTWIQIYNISWSQPARECKFKTQAGHSLHLNTNY